MSNLRGNPGPDETLRHTETLFHIPWMTRGLIPLKLTTKPGQNQEKQRDLAMHVQEHGLLLWTIKIAAI